MKGAAIQKNANNLGPIHESTILFIVTLLQSFLPPLLGELSTEGPAVTRELGCTG